MLSVGSFWSKFGHDNLLTFLRYFAGANSYPWVKRGAVNLKRLSKERNRMSLLGLESRPLDNFFSSMTHRNVIASPMETIRVILNKHHFRVLQKFDWLHFFALKIWLESSLYKFYDFLFHNETFALISSYEIHQVITRNVLQDLMLEVLQIFGFAHRSVTWILQQVRNIPVFK